MASKLVTCDKWEFENDDKENPYIGASPILLETHKVFVRESYVRNTRMFSGDDLPFTVEAASDEFFAAWRGEKEAQDVHGRPLTLGGPISFCYVDGNHTYERVKQDFLNYDEFLANGGFLLFDDSTVATFGVRDLMPEVAATGRYKLVAANPNQLYQKIR